MSDSNTNVLSRLISGYAPAQVVYVFAKLGIAERLTEGPRSVVELAAATQTLSDRLFRVLRAAASLGASPLRVMVTITLPLLLPGLVSGWLFAAMLSLNEFTASLFVTAQRTQTLPVAMYNYVREFADPSMAALSVMYIAATASLIIFANACLGLGKVLNIEQAR